MAGHRNDQHVFRGDLNLGDPYPKFNFNESGAPVYAHPRFLPASIVRSSQIDRSLIADGCTIEKSTIEHSMIGIRSIVASDSILKDVILMGADEYEMDMAKERVDRPRIGIGRGATSKGRSSIRMPGSVTTSSYRRRARTRK